jgi:hypothetical protein
MKEKVFPVGVFLYSRTSSGLTLSQPNELREKRVVKKRMDEYLKIIFQR